MDKFTQQFIFDTIKTAENKELWSVAGLLAKHVKEAEKATGAAKRAEAATSKKLEKKIAILEQDLEETIAEAKLSADLSDNISDDQLRQHIKSFLVNRLKDKSISAAEIGQIKDLFNLADAKQDIHIEMISWESTHSEQDSRENATDVQ